MDTCSCGGSLVGYVAIYFPAVDGMQQAILEQTIDDGPRPKQG